jgi:LmbE family N-acetylglucosaminyl deacetylase
VGRGISEPINSRNNGASGQFAANASLIRLAVSRTRTAIFNNRSRMVEKSAPDRASPRGMAAWIVRTTGSNWTFTDEDLTRLIRRHRPDAVLCGDPTVRYYGANYLNHPDHRAAADVTLDAVFPSAETRLIFPELLAEGLEPHKVRWVFIHGTERPDTFIDIADTLGAKLAALKEHRTQMGKWDPTEMITGWAGLQGAERGLAAAESFRLMRLHED